MANQILYIVNPESGEGANREEILERVTNKLNDSDLYVLETAGKNDAARIKDKLSEKAWSAVLVGGGDGTIKLVAESMVGVNIPIGIIPMGSANGLARCLDILNIQNS